MIYLLALSLSKFFAQFTFLDDLLKIGPAICQAAIPTGAWRTLDSAIVCGVNLPNGALKQSFVDSGLIHLIVVSGSHIAFLEISLSFLPKRAQFCVLAFYGFLVGLQAPIVRALIRRWITPSLEHKFGLTNLQLEAATAIVVLFIYPPWIISRSFLMSWMCGLALAAPRPKIFHQHFEQAVMSYLFLLPFCWAAPTSILWNTIVAPIVGSVLLPVRLVTVAFHFISPLTDYFWKAFILIIENGPLISPLPIFIESKYLLLLPLFTHIALLTGEVQWRRAYAFS